jgi:16S rRNA (cytidine1402-2'-O)-methyltransferase
VGQLFDQLGPAGMTGSPVAAEAGLLLLAATPIGDSQDASPALRQALLEADLIAAEDTRRCRALAQRLGLTLTAEVVSYFEANEATRTGQLLERLRAGARVVLISDAGMPLVSDPGYRLVRAAIDAAIPITAVPGPSAVLTALALSGLAVDRFCFEGFLPRKSGQRQTRLTALANEERTMVFFEAPHRLAAFLADAKQVFGSDRSGAICREMTKLHQEIIRGTLAELTDWAAGPVLGEITLVIAGAAPLPINPTAAVELVRSLIETGLSPTKAVAQIAKSQQLDRRQLYDWVIAAAAEASADVGWNG